MKSTYERYAIYYAPRPSPFSTFCAEWLGWDAQTATALAPPVLADISASDIARLTQTPRKYGFHGTIKPPFRVTTSQEALQHDFRALCATLQPIALNGLRLDALGRFLALTVTDDAAPLAALAARVVQELDPHRAPPNEAELAKRRRARLSARQKENLQNWGYPYVLDDFKFHLTLSGRLDANDLEMRMAIFALSSTSRLRVVSDLLRG